MTSHFAMGGVENFAMGGVENDVTFDPRLYTEEDPKSFSWGDVMSNLVEC